MGLPHSRKNSGQRAGKKVIESAGLLKGTLNKEFGKLYERRKSNRYLQGRLCPFY